MAGRSLPAEVTYSRETRVPPSDAQLELSATIGKDLRNVDMRNEGSAEVRSAKGGGN